MSFSKHEFKFEYSQGKLLLTEEMSLAFMDFLGDASHNLKRSMPFEVVQWHSQQLVETGNNDSVIHYSSVTAPSFEQTEDHEQLQDNIWTQNYFSWPNYYGVVCFFQDANLDSALQEYIEKISHCQHHWHKSSKTFYPDYESNHWAYHQGNKHHILKLANQKNVSYVDPYLRDTLHQACRQGWLDIIQLLIEEYSDPNVSTKSKSNQSLLHYACRHGHIKIVELLTEMYGCDPNVVTRSDKILLHYAYQYGHSDVVELLIEKHGCDPSYKVVTKSDESPLHYACLYGHINIVKLFIEKYGCDFQYVMTQNLLQHACQYGHIDFVEYLVNENPDSDYSDLEGNTTLHIACQANKLALVSCLIDQACCDRNKNNKLGSLSLDMTTNFKYFCQHEQVKVHIYSNTIVHRIVDYACMLCILQSVDNHKTRSQDGSTLLHVACTCDRNVVEYLVTGCQCDPNCLDSKGQMSLQLTSDLGSKIMKTLVEHGAKMTTDVFKIMSCGHITETSASELLASSKRKGTMQWNSNDLNGDGDAALHLTCKLGKATIVSNLLAEDKCNLNSLDMSPLLEMTKNLEIAKLLIKHGAKVTPELVLRFEAMESTPNKSTIIEVMSNSWNPDAMHNHGYTALHLACKVDCPATVNLLLSDSHYDPKIKGGVNGYSALHLACKVGNHVLVKRLLSLGHCDPSNKNYIEEVTLQLTSDLRIMKTLIEHGVQMTTDVFKLISECNKDSVRLSELFKLSIRKGAVLWNRNDLNSDGCTALHLGYKVDSFAIMNFLLTVAHCDPNIRSQSGEVPLQLTANTEIIKHLIRYGAKTSMMFVSDQNSLKTNKPIQPPVFIFGNASVGKITLTAALKTNIGIFAQLFSGKVSGVDKKTVVIVQHDLESKIFGRVTMYDFAGHREFYSGHAALLQTAIQSENTSNKSTLIELMLTTWNPDDRDNHGFTALHLACKPDLPATVNLLLPDFHNPNIKRGVNGYSALRLVRHLLTFSRCDPSNKNYIDEVPLQLTSDLGIMKTLVEHGAQMTTYVAYKLISKCNKEPQRAIDLFELSIRKGTMLWNPNDLNSDGYTALHLGCKVDTFAIVNILLTVAHYDPNIKSQSGEMPLQLTANTEVIEDLIRHGAKTSMMYVSDQNPLKTNKPIQPPVFIVANASVGKSTLTAASKTNIGTINDEQFFSSRFLQVLLLRLAFSFALKVSGSDQKFGIHRKSSIWKNRIFWGSYYNMYMFDKVTDNKSMTVMAHFETVISLECFCPGVETAKSFIDSSSSHLLKYVKKLPRKVNWFSSIFNDSASVPSSKNIDDLFHELIKWRNNKRTYKVFRQELDQYNIFAGRNILVSMNVLCEVHNISLH